MDLHGLADRLDSASLEPEHRGTLAFKLFRGEGWITSTTGESTIRLLCDVFNNRKAIAAALRSVPPPGP